MSTQKRLDDKTTWLTGTGVPGAGLGSNGYFYKDDSTGKEYKKSSGTWNEITSISNSEDVVVIGTNTTAVSGKTYVLTASLTLTLPVSPVAGNVVKVSNRSGTTTPVITRNGENIMGFAEDLTVNIQDIGLMLVYSNSTLGWVII